MPRNAPIHISDFIPDSEMFLDATGKSAFARGKLYEHIRHLIWEAMIDPGPRCQTHVEIAHNLSRPEWIDDPIRALADIDTLTAPGDAAIERAAALGVSASDILPEGGDWIHYGRARAVFGKYHAALVKMRLAKEVEFEVLIG